MELEIQISSNTSLIDFYDNMRKDSADFFDGVHPDSIGDSILARIVNNAIEKSPSGIIRAVQISSNSSLIDFYDNMTKDSADFFDGIHPDSIGDSIMARIVYEALQKSPSGLIRNFSARRNNVTSAGLVTLYWQTTSGSGVTLGGQKVGESDSLIVHPDRTTIYTLTTSGTFSDTSLIKVEVAGSH